VLVRFALSRYLDSDIYYGRSVDLPWEEAEPQTLETAGGAQQQIEAPKSAPENERP
jgi:hypothetical protein